jgi:riboflavin synthase
LFTGIIQDVGVIENLERRERLSTVVLRSELARDMQVGGSISVNGTCLTATAVDGDSITVEIGGESLARTALGEIAPGDRVNLELPMRANALFDGHIVQGHVDGVGTIAAISEDGESQRIRVEASESILRYLVEKGSVTLDGISLTVASVDRSGFDVAIIPHTLAVTTLGLRQVGETVNLEVDVLAKYVERLLNN